MWAVESHRQLVEFATGGAACACAAWHPGRPHLAVSFISAAMRLSICARNMTSRLAQVLAISHGWTAMASGVADAGAALMPQGGQRLPATQNWLQLATADARLDIYGFCVNLHFDSCLSGGLRGQAAARFRYGRGGAGGRDAAAPRRRAKRRV